VKTKTKSMWWKLKKAQAKLFCAKVEKEIKKLAVAIVITEFVIAGAIVIVSNYNYFGLLDSKTVYIEVSHAQNAPERTELPQDEVLDIKAISDTIWLLESSRGQHNYSKCEAVGKINGIGWSIDGTGKYTCFNNHEEEMVVLGKWIQDKINKGFSEKELLCYYNTGKVSSTCNYISNML
jgi:hypothetical protein